MHACMYVCRFYCNSQCFPVSFIIFILATCFILSFFRYRVMARNGYKKITDDAETKKASFVSLLFFQWMNIVFKTGSERALQKNHFLPLPEENTSSFVITRLRTKWEKEESKCKENGKEPKLWKSALKMLSTKDVVLIVSTGAMFVLCRILQPLLLGYLYCFSDVSYTAT